jgi:hypothetical protein
MLLGRRHLCLFRLAILDKEPIAGDHKDPPGHSPPHSPIPHTINLPVRPIYRMSEDFSRPVGMAEVNHQPALIFRTGDQALLVLTIEVEAEHIQAIRLIANPEKLARI